MNGWKTADADYLKDVAEASKYIDSIFVSSAIWTDKTFQAKNISSAMKDNSAKIIMWDVLSGDFDQSIYERTMLTKCNTECKGGSIVVFHDSEKAFPLLEYCLPRTLDFFAAKGFRFERLLKSRS